MSSHTQSSASDPSFDAWPFSVSASVSTSVADPVSGGARESTCGCGLSAMAPMLGAWTCANSAGAPVLHPSEGRTRPRSPGVNALPLPVACRSERFDDFAHQPRGLGRRLADLHARGLQGLLLGLP